MEVKNSKPKGRCRDADRESGETILVLINFHDFRIYSSYLLIIYQKSLFYKVLITHLFIYLNLYKKFK